MSKLEKAKERLLTCPRDYTYTEAKNSLLNLDLRNSIRGKLPTQESSFLGNQIKVLLCCTNLIRET